MSEKRYIVAIEGIIVAENMTLYHTMIFVRAMLEDICTAPSTVTIREMEELT